MRNYGLDGIERLSMQDLDDCAEALRARTEELDRQAAHLDEVETLLRGGGTAPLFATGHVGADAAKDSAYAKRARIDRLRRLVRTIEEIQGH